ncbi:Lrp/AsnC family transcriptional regulator [Candidatus Woesearchaeota archaeon]|nr:Lrp/AsnC family transcriptional regulator [Candidatus Woesearchaeota archaeon]
MYKLDQKNRRIVFELDRNSRQSINELASITKLSRDVVSYRMKQLEKAGIIQKYIAVIDYGRFSYQFIRLYVGLQNTTPEIEENIARFFVEEKHCQIVFRSSGRHDLVVGFLVKSLAEYQQIYDRFLQQFRAHVAHRFISLFLSYHHFCRNYLVDKKQQDHSIIITGNQDPFVYDEKDLQLLNIIKENARITLLDLAHELKMTPAGVKYKLRGLEKQKVILGYKILLDFSQLGYQYFKIDLELEDLSIIPALAQYILQHPNIIYREITLGGSDFEFDGEFKNDLEFYQFMDELKKLFPQQIRHYSFYQALKIYKYSYFPEEFLNSKTKKPQKH